MPNLPNPRPEKFAQSLAKGKTAETRRPTSPAIYAQGVIDPAKVVRTALQDAPAMPAGGMDF